MTAHGRHHRPPWYRRILDRLHARRQRRQVEAARDDAYVVRIEAHAVPPLTWARHALAAHLAAYSEAVCAANGLPPAAVLPDEAVPGLEHLAEGQYSGDDTLAFGMSIMKAGQQWMP